MTNGAREAGKRGYGEKTKSKTKAPNELHGEAAGGSGGEKRGGGGEKGDEGTGAANTDRAGGKTTLTWGRGPRSRTRRRERLEPGDTTRGDKNTPAYTTQGTRHNGRHNDREQ